MSPHERGQKAIDTLRACGLRLCVLGQNIEVKGRRELFPLPEEQVQLIESFRDQIILALLQSQPRYDEWLVWYDSDGNVTRMALNEELPWDVPDRRGARVERLPCLES